MTKKRVIFIVSTIVVIAIIAILSAPLFSGFSVNNESLIMPYVSSYPLIDDDGILQIFTASGHSWLVMSMFFVEFARYLPKILHLHPQICIQTVTAKFFFGIFFLFLFAITNNFFKYAKNKTCYAVGLLSSFYFVISLLRKCDFLWMFASDCWFWAYIFLPISAIILFSYLEKYYVLREKPTKREIVSVAILFLITAVGHEFFRFVLIVGVLLMFLVEKYLIKSDIPTKKFFKYYIAATAICVFTIFSYSYQSWLNIYTQGEQTAMFPYFIKYLRYFIEYIINAFSPLYALLLFLGITIHFFVKNKQNNYRLYNYMASFTVAGILFFWAIMAGNDGFGYEVPLMHSGLRFLFGILLLCLIASATGYLLTFADTKSKNKYIISVGIFLLAALSVGTARAFDFSYFQKDSFETRRDMYIFEKTFLLNKNKKDLYIFDENSYRITHYYLFDTYFNNKADFEVKNIEICKDISDKDKCRDLYLKTVEDKIGYKFTKEELDRLDFNSLYKL